MNRTCRAAKHTRCRGFTLLEASIVVTLVSLGVAVAIPSYHGLLQRQRESATTNLLTSFMASARSTAISYHTPTVVCPYDGQKGCRADSDWTQGWMMFYDPDGNRQPDLPDEILRMEHAPRDAGLRIVSTSGRPRATFLANGSAAGSNLTIRLCQGSTTRAAVIVNRSGRARVERTADDGACAD